MGTLRSTVAQTSELFALRLHAPHEDLDETSDMRAMGGLIVGAIPRAVRTLHQHASYAARVESQALRLNRAFARGPSNRLDQERLVLLIVVPNHLSSLGVP